MAQIFHPSMNVIAKASIFGAVLLGAVVGLAATAFDHSPYQTQAGIVRQQPVPFSHAHHVKGLGIDCRYCHTSVTESHFAGVPATKTCMTCHSQIWRDAPMLQPVRTSWATNTPLQWNRVHNLPQFVYFNHSIHIAKGVGCQTCHGLVNQMPLMYQTASLQMEWCLTCHRNPEKFINVPPDQKDQAFNMDYKPDEPQETLGPKLVELYHVHKEQLTNCSICHR